MANHRKPTKGKKKGGKKAARKRKSSERVANARKLTRYNELIREGKTKTEAHLEAYGTKRKARKNSRKAGKKAAKVGKKAGKSKSHRRYSPLRNADFALILAEIQAANGTTGIPASPEERQLARDTMELARSYEGSKVEGKKEKARREIAAKKRQLLDEIKAEKRKEAERKEKEAREAEYEQEAKDELRDLDDVDPKKSWN